MTYLEQVREILADRANGFWIDGQLVQNEEGAPIIALAIADIDPWVSVEERLPEDGSSAINGDSVWIRVE